MATLVAVPPFLSLNNLGAIGNGSTDDATAINAALAGGPGIYVGGNASYALKSPVIVPNATILAGIGGIAGGTELKAVTGFPTTTTTGFTTPAAITTTFSLAVASTAGFPLGAGGITPPNGIGVLCVAGITVYYTGTNATHFTGCQVGASDLNVTVANTRNVSTFMVWLTDPGATGVGFGTRVENIRIECNNIAGIGGVHSAHVQEQGGLNNVTVWHFGNFGFRFDSCPMLTGNDQPVNWTVDHVGPLFSATCEPEAIGFDYMLSNSGAGSNVLGGGRSINNCGVGTAGGVLLGACAIRLNAFTGAVRDTYFENMNDGLLIGDKYRCAVLVENISNGANWGSGSLVHLASTIGNAATVLHAAKQSGPSVPGRVVLKDDINTVSYIKEQLQSYVLRDDGSYSINGGSRVAASTLRPSASMEELGTTWFSPDTGRLSVCDGARWYPLQPVAGITLIADNIASGARDNSSANTLTVTFTAATSSGTHCLIGCGQSGNFTLTGIVDSRGNTWQVDKVSTATQGFTASAASCKVTVPHQIGDTLTLTYSGSSTYAAGIVSNWSGLKTSSWLDVVKANAGVASAPSSGATPARTQIDELLYGVCATSTDTQTQGSGYTLLTSKSSGSGARIVTPVYAVVSSIGTDPVTWTGVATNYEIAATTYKAAASTA